MNYQWIITELSRNNSVFEGLLKKLPNEEVRWRPAPEKWCLLEIICHLYDEEREDFRARTKHVLETPHSPMPSYDPLALVKDRNYMGQDFNTMLNKFLVERQHSVEWLNSLKDPKWDNAYQHPKLGKMTASLFLSNWLAHDYIHIRQILKVKFAYLQQDSGEPLSYAGNW